MKILMFILRNFVCMFLHPQVQCRAK